MAPTADSLKWRLRKGDLWRGRDYLLLGRASNPMALGPILPESGA